MHVRFTLPRTIATVLVVLAGLAAIALGILVLGNNPLGDDNTAYFAWADIAVGIGLVVSVVLD